LKAGAWLRRVRFVIISPVPRHNRQVQAETPLKPVFEFGQPPLPLPLILRLPLFSGNRPVFNGAFWWNLRGEFQLLAGVIPPMPIFGHSLL